MAKATFVFKRDDGYKRQNEHVKYKNLLNIYFKLNYNHIFGQFGKKSKFKFYCLASQNE